MKFQKKKALCFNLAAAQLLALVPMTAIVVYAATDGGGGTGSTDDSSSSDGTTSPESSSTPESTASSGSTTSNLPAAPSGIKTTYPENGYVRLYQDSLAPIENLEYQIGNDGSWTTYYDGTEIYISGADSISVRYAATSTTDASSPANVSVNANNNANLSFSAPLFGNLEYEYSAYDYLPITIKNTGPGTAQIKSVEMDYGYFYIYSGMATVKGGTVNTDILIAPAAGLPVGTYTSKFKITYTDNASAVDKTQTVPVTVKVIPRKIPAYTVPTSVYQDQLTEEGFPVEFYSESGAISSITLVKKPTGFVKNTAGTKGTTAYFYPGAVAGDYMFEIVPVDYALYQKNYVTVSVVNDEYNPAVAKSSVQITNKIDAAGTGDTVMVSGVTTITSAQVKAAAAKGITFDVKINDNYSWTIEAAKLSDTKSSLNLALTNETIPTSEVKNAVFGSYTKTIGFSCRASCGSGGSLTVKTGDSSTAASPSYANLYKYSDKGELVFKTAVPIKEDGSAVVPIEESGVYAVVTAKETKLIGDLDNSCTISTKDALAILKMIAAGEKPTVKNTPKAAFAGKNKISTADALAILKYIAQ